MPALEQIILDPPSGDSPVDPTSWFPKPGSLELELGCGKGGFLLERAMVHPDRRFVGIEWANKIFLYAADRMARRGLENVRIMRTDARDFVMRFLPPCCLEALHVYHPDPWPKKRHHKRRLVQPDFADAAIRSLKPNAEWLLQTDHVEYFEQMRAVLCAASDLREIEWTESACRPRDGWIGTNYEIKYTREGRAIYRIAFRKL
jgi:tRNA (guanine-N7-)-methyltransferase